MELLWMVGPQALCSGGMGLSSSMSSLNYRLCLISNMVVISKLGQKGFVDGWMSFKR